MDIEKDLQRICDALRIDGQALLDFINEVEDYCHPDARFSITEKGRLSLDRNANNDV